MLSTLGNVLQAIALALALASAVLLIAGAKFAPIPVGTSHATSAPGRARAAARMRDLGYMLTYVTFALLTACVAIILFAMLSEDYTLAYVVSNYPATDSPLQPLYRVSAVWAGRQGSLLLWTWLISAFAIILFAMLSEDYTLAYVVSNYPATDSPLQPLYRVSAVWAGRQGSLLLRTGLIAAFAAAQAHRRRHAKDDLTVVALGVSQVVVALFAGALVFSASNNPFMPTAAQYLTADGGLVSKIGGMNPLLMHWAMILHPPATFIGYAAMTLRGRRARLQDRRHEPPAHALGHDLAPAGDLHRLRRHDPAVRLRHGFAHHR